MTPIGRRADVGARGSSRSLAAWCALCAVLTAGPSLAQQNCSPQSLVGRAVGGEVLNQILGGFSRIAGGVAGIENGISPTPSSVFTDCILPRINPPARDPGPTDSSPILSSPPRTPSVGWGDPHLVTHDGLGYDFQGAGDYAYVDSPGLTVQARHFRLSPQAFPSRIEAYAVRFGETTVVINDPIDPSLIGSAPGLDDVVTVDGVDTPIGLGGWIDLDDAGSFVQRYRNRTYLHVAGQLDLLVSHDGNTFQLALDNALRGAVAGLLGDFDGDIENDLVTSGGDPFSIDDTATLYGDYLSGWSRTGEDSLFNSVYDPEVSGGVVPPSRIELSGASVSEREAAVVRCREAGAEQGFLLQSCVYDLIFDGDDALLTPLAVLQGNTPDAVSAVGVGAVAGVDPIELSIDDRVSVAQPAPGAGRLSAPFEVDRYRVIVPAGTPRSLAWQDPCSTASTVQLLIAVDGGKPADLSPSCEGAIALPGGTLDLSVYAPGGDAADYRFALIEPVSTDLGTVDRDALVTGERADAEGLIATLPGDAGETLYLASEQVARCEQSWRVLDGTGTVLGRNSACNDLGRFTLGDAVPYRVSLDAAAAGRYAFRALVVGDAVTVGAGATRAFVLTVSTPGQVPGGVFDAAAGERLYIDREGGVGSGILVLSDSSGTEVGRSPASRADLEVTAVDAGTYELTLQPRGDFTGSVPVDIVSVADDTNIAVNRGQSFTLTLTTLGQRASGSFAVQAGETFTVDVLGADIVSGMDTLPRVVAPDSVTPTLVFFGSRTVTAAVTGTYQIVLDSDERDDFIGSVRFRLE